MTHVMPKPTGCNNSSKSYASGNPTTFLPCHPGAFLCKSPKQFYTCVQSVDEKWFWGALRDVAPGTICRPKLVHDKVQKEKRSLKWWIVGGDDHPEGNDENGKGMKTNNSVDAVVTKLDGLSEALARLLAYYSKREHTGGWQGWKKIKRQISQWMSSNDRASASSDDDSKEPVDTVRAKMESLTQNVDELLGYYGKQKTPWTLRWRPSLGDDGSSKPGVDDDSDTIAPILDKIGSLTDKVGLLLSSKDKIPARYGSRRRLHRRLDDNEDRGSSSWNNLMHFSSSPKVGKQEHLVGSLEPTLDVLDDLSCAVRHLLKVHGLETSFGNDNSFHNKHYETENAHQDLKKRQFEEGGTIDSMLKFSDGSDGGDGIDTDAKAMIPHTQPDPVLKNSKDQSASVSDDVASSFNAMEDGTDNPPLGTAPTRQSVNGGIPSLKSSNANDGGDGIDADPEAMFGDIVSAKKSNADSGDWFPAAAANEDTTATDTFNVFDSFNERSMRKRQDPDFVFSDGSDGGDGIEDDAEAIFGEPKDPLLEGLFDPNSEGSPSSVNPGGGLDVSSTEDVAPASSTLTLSEVVPEETIADFTEETSTSLSEEISTVLPEETSILSLEASDTAVPEASSTALPEGPSNDSSEDTSTTVTDETSVPDFVDVSASLPEETSTTPIEESDTTLSKDADSMGEKHKRQDQVIPGFDFSDGSDGGDGVDDDATALFGPEPDNYDQEWPVSEEQQGDKSESVVTGLVSASTLAPVGTATGMEGEPSILSEIPIQASVAAPSTSDGAAIEVPTAASTLPDISIEPLEFMEKRQGMAAIVRPGAPLLAGKGKSNIAVPTAKLPTTPDKPISPSAAAIAQAVRPALGPVSNAAAQLSPADESGPIGKTANISENLHGPIEGSSVPKPDPLLSQGSPSEPGDGTEDDAETLFSDIKQPNQGADASVNVNSGDVVDEDVPDLSVEIGSVSVGLPKPSVEPDVDSADFEDLTPIETSEDGAPTSTAEPDGDTADIDAPTAIRTSIVAVPTSLFLLDVDPTDLELSTTLEISSVGVPTSPPESDVDPTDVKVPLPGESSASSIGLGEIDEADGATSTSLISLPVSLPTLSNASLIQATALKFSADLPEDTGANEQNLSEDNANGEGESKQWEDGLLPNFHAPESLDPLLLGLGSSDLSPTSDPIDSEESATPELPDSEEPLTVAPTHTTTDTTETDNVAAEILPLFMGHGPVMPPGVSIDWPHPLGGFITALPLPTTFDTSTSILPSSSTISGSSPLGTTSTSSISLPPKKTPTIAVPEARCVVNKVEKVKRVVAERKAEIENRQLRQGSFACPLVPMGYYRDDGIVGAL